MNGVEICLVSKNINLQITFKELVEKNILLENLIVMENEDELIKYYLKTHITNVVYVYDNDFSPSLNSVLFTQWFTELFSEVKVIILGNSVIEARELINNQACPFGYINKKEHSNIISATLLDLLSKDEDGSK